MGKYDLEIVEFDYNRKQIKELAYGRTDVSIMGLSEGSFCIRKFGFSNFVILGELNLPNISNSGKREATPDRAKQCLLCARPVMSSRAMAGRLVPS